MSITVDQLDLFEDEGEPRLPGVPKKHPHAKVDYRKVRTAIPVRNGMPFCIVPEVAPILEELTKRAALEAGQDLVRDDRKMSGTTILGARAAIILGTKESAAVRRLHAVLYKRQLFINARFIEGCLMAMDAEHEYVYGEWPSSRADALEKVAIEAEIKGKNVSPTKLLNKANRLYEKGYRKALKHFPEVTP